LKDFDALPIIVLTTDQNLEAEMENVVTNPGYT
jgi:hypothetical protein